MSAVRNRLEAMLNRIWYGETYSYVLLLPLSGLFALLVALRRYLYRQGILQSYRLPVPVVVIGNITVGGGGKTPVTLWLAEVLKGRGLKPAIISRGYGGKAAHTTVQVSADSDPGIVGDEPVLLARRSDCPVYVNANRVMAAAEAVKRGANIIISDDGLQHYRLQRDAEIAVVDGSRGLGNGHLLPAGPLREPASRLQSVDRIMIQGEIDGATTRYGNRGDDIRSTRFVLAGETLQRISDGACRGLSEFAGKTVHAVAGIANPERFFRQLECHGINVMRHPMADHARISAADVSFDDKLDVIVTEKDAVKCAGFAHEHLWCQPVHIAFTGDLQRQWIDALHAKLLASVAAESA